MSMVEMLPRHAQVQLRLEQRIRQMHPDDRLPAERELAKSFDVSRDTMRRTLRSLIDSGVLESRHGAGTFVRQHPGEATAAPTRTNLIGLAVPTVEWPTIARFVTGAERAASANGLRLVLAHDYGDPARQLAQLRELLEQGIDGLIVFLDKGNVSCPDYAAFMRELRHRPEKLVLVDRYPEGIEVPTVMTDTLRGMYALTKHLLDLGHRRFATLSWGPESGLAHTSRMAGLQQALLQAGLPSQPTREGIIGYRSPATAVPELIHGWLREGNGKLPFDAIVAFVDDMAYAAYRTLRDAGLRVPEDVALTGFDNIYPELYSAAGLELTTVEQPFAEIGRVAVERLLALRDGETGQATTLLSPRLIIRRSCGAQP